MYLSLFVRDCDLQSLSGNEQTVGEEMKWNSSKTDGNSLPEIKIAKEKKKSLSGRPISSASRRNQRRRESYRENQIVQEVLQLDVTNVESQKVLVAASTLKLGQKYLSGFLPPSSQSVEYIQKVKLVHENTKTLLQNKKSSHEKREMMQLITQGLTSKDISHVTGLSERTGRRIAAFNRNEAVKNSLQSVPVIKTKMHHKLCDFEVQIYKRWFESNTEVRSGSSTVLRQVPTSKHQFLFGLFASFPSLLRSASKSPGGQLALQKAQQSHDKTRFEIALISSQTEVPDVNEYSVRYEYIKNRYKELLQKKAKIINKKPKRLSKKTEEFAASIFQLETMERHPVQKRIKEIMQIIKTEKQDKETATNKNLKSELKEKKAQLHSINCAIQKVPTK